MEKTFFDTSVLVSAMVKSHPAHNRTYPYFEKVFHGVTLDEYQKIVNAQYKLLDKKPHRKLKNKPANKDIIKQIDDLLLFIIKQK